MLPRAVQDLDGLFSYIASELKEPETARKMAGRIEDGIYSLETMPYRCPERKIGAYANRGYRQLLIGSYTILYRVDEEKKLVIVVTVRYSASQF